MNERTSFASWASAFESSRLVIGLKWTSDQKVARVSVAFEWNKWRLRRDSTSLRIVWKWFKVFKNDRFNWEFQKNSIPFPQFGLVFPKSVAMCQLFDKLGYPVSVDQAGHHRAQSLDRQSALQTAQKENTDRIPLTLAFHPHNHAVKTIILKKSFSILWFMTHYFSLFSLQFESHRRQRLFPVYAGKSFWK